MTCNLVVKNISSPNQFITYPVFKDVAILVLRENLPPKEMNEVVKRVIIGAGL